MSELENKIAYLKDGRTLKELKQEDTKLYYKVKSMASKLSVMKAEDKGQFITKKHLREYKGLIIWLLKNKTNYKGYLIIKDAMSLLLSTIERDNIVYKTKRGIKGIISREAIHAGLMNAETNLREDKGIPWTVNTYGNPILEDFEQFKLNAIM